MKALSLTLVLSLTLPSLGSAANLGIELPTVGVVAAPKAVDPAAPLLAQPNLTIPAAVPSLPATPLAAAAIQATAAAPSAASAKPAASATAVLHDMAQPMANAQGVSGAPKLSAAQVFDGIGIRASAEDPAFNPGFEPARSGGDRGGMSGGGDGNGGNRGNGGRGGDGDGPSDNDKQLKLSFPNQAQVSRLHSFNQDEVIHGVLKRIRPSPVFKGPAKKELPPMPDGRPRSSREAWERYKVGVEVEIQSRGEDVFGRKTPITYAVTKKISKMTREDLKGIFPAIELKAPIAKIRQAVIERMEDDRRTWKPEDPPVTLDTELRVIKFKSFAQLFREANGPDAIPKQEEPKPRAPLQTTAEGKLSPFATTLPRAVFLDVDALEGPISKDLLSDMMKLQRTGVYFVAFSRKGYDAPGGVHERLIKQMSAYQLSILLPIRFMAVTDDGAVIHEFPRGGNAKAVDVDQFSAGAFGIMDDAAQKASEAVGLAPRQVKLERDDAQRIRYQAVFSKDVTQKQAEDWLAAFGRGTVEREITATMKLVELDGKKTVVVQRGDLLSSKTRLQDALGKKFGLYLNPSDILVLSDDPGMRAINPYLDFANETGLKGSERVENALGLLLGEHRENVAGDLSGSASRVTQFRRDRTRYMSDYLLKQDNEEQNINFFSGHVVHATNDWLIWNLQNGKVPTPAEYEANLRQRWDEGLREIKAVAPPGGNDMRGWIDSRVTGGLNMYRQVVASYNRGEILVGAEIPNFFMLKEREKRTEKLKRRYIVHTIFDFLALRPDPKNPGHATLVIYDFKTGPAQEREHLEKDIQVLTYALFAKLRWIGKTFPAPYFSGDKGYTIDDVSVEFIYNAIQQPTTISNWSLDKIRRTIVTTLDRIHKSEQTMLGTNPAKKKAPAKKAAKKTTKKAAKKTRKA